jgi:protease PrsW
MTAVSSESLAADRARAIEESGWGEDFHFVQPRNLAFWVYCLLVIAGANVLRGEIDWALTGYGDALLSGIVIFGLLTIPFLWFIHHEDRFTTVPGKLALAAFVFGALGSIGAFAMHGNTAVLNLWSKLLGADFAYDWGAALTAPFIEETAKGAGVLLLLVLAPRLIRSPFDGLIVGAFVGLGFQIVEDVSYSYGGAASAFGDNGAAVETSLARVLFSIPSHWLFTAIFGAGLIWFLGRPQVPRRRGLGLALMGTAMLMHGIWDGLGAIEGGSPLLGVLPFVVGVIAVVLFVAVYKRTVPTERNWMRELLAPEIALGVLTEPEVDAVAGTRKDRKAFLHQAADRRRTARHILTGATDLARQIARDRGADTPAVQHARAEIARLRQH